MLHPFFFGVDESIDVEKIVDAAHNDPPVILNEKMLLTLKLFELHSERENYLMQLKGFHADLHLAVTRRRLNSSVRHFKTLRHNGLLSSFESSRLCQRTNQTISHIKVVLDKVEVNRVLDRHMELPFVIRYLYRKPSTDYLVHHIAYSLRISKWLIHVVI